MTCFLKTAFARKAGVALLGSAAMMAGGSVQATEPGGSDGTVRTLLQSHTVCIKTGELKDLPFWRPAERYIAGLVRKAELSIAADDKDTMICADPTIQVYRSGAYDGKQNAVFLSYPSSLNRADVPRSEEDIVLTLRHEWRHRMQKKEGFDDIALDMNLPLADRVRMRVAAEADARVEAVVFADRMRLRGKPEYVAGMMQDDGNRKPMEAYLQAIGKHPRDGGAARRAAFTAFYGDKGLVATYCSTMWSGVPYRGSDAPPAYADGKSPALSDETLTRLGSRAGQKSYMNQALFKLVRQACGS